MGVDASRRQRQCPECSGTGIQTELSGEWARSKRLALGWSLRELGRRMGVSAMYLSDLEVGRRRFGEAIARRYLAAIGESQTELRTRTDGEVWRDDSPPAFTGETPLGSHAAWRFRFEGRDFGPYFTRSDAERAMEMLLSEPAS